MNRFRRWPNSTNHRIATDHLELTAQPNLGGVYNGGISSGQITTKETFFPQDGRTYVCRSARRCPRPAPGSGPAYHRQRL
ncbi:MAG TPA: hypothetical protein VK659_17130 [Asanoa sp.]|nr:hypothetical protein [Asanoa sp.]